MRVGLLTLVTSRVGSVTATCFFVSLGDMRIFSGPMSPASSGALPGHNCTMSGLSVPTTGPTTHSKVSNATAAGIRFMIAPQHWPGPAWMPARNDTSRHRKSKDVRRRVQGSVTGKASARPDCPQRSRRCDQLHRTACRSRPASRGAARSRSPRASFAPLESSTAAPTLRAVLACVSKKRERRCAPA